MRTFFFVTLLSLAIAAASSALEKEVTSIGGADLVVYRHTFDNGLTLLMMENHVAPTVGLATTFRVGSVDEHDGISGATHILEHMLFKGSDRIGTTDWELEEPLLEKVEELRLRIRKEERKGDRADDGVLASLRKEWKSVREKADKLGRPEEIGKIYTENGGRRFNAGTNYDYTVYMISLPVNRLELWMYIESERLRAPVLRGFYTEIENIREERLMSVEDDPQGKLWETALAAAYRAHRYGVEIIGWDSDLRTINRSEVEDYFKTYYAPNRMIISIVGDIDPEKTVEMVQAYFGDFERMPDPEPVETVEPEQIGEHRLEVEFDAEPSLFIGYHKPATGDPLSPPLRMANVILNRGRSSRMTRNVVQKGIARRIMSDVDSPGERFPNLFFFGVEPQSPHTVADAENAIYAELDTMKERLVSEAELDRARTYIETNYVREFADNLNAAIKLGTDEAVLGSWMARTAEITACRDVTPEEIRAAARKVFRRKNRTVAWIVRPEKTVAEADSEVER